MYIGPDGVDQSAAFITDDVNSYNAWGQLLQLSGGCLVLILVILKSALCFSSPAEDDPERVASFQISPWSCLCNIFRLLLFLIGPFFNQSGHLVTVLLTFIQFARAFVM